MNFDLANTPINKGVNRLEASAGTGKTFALAGLFLRLLLEEKVSAREILVVTFTEAATAELRDRIRKRLAEVLVVLEGGTTTDPLLLRLAEQVKPRQSAAILSLRNALEVFDLVSICTIHGFCQRTLQDSAFESGILFDVELITDQQSLIREVAADYCRNRLHGCDPLMASIALQAKLDPDTLSKLLKQYLTYPELELVTSEPVGSVKELEQDIRTSFEHCTQAWQAIGGSDTLVDHFTKGEQWAVKEHAKEEVLGLHAQYLGTCKDTADLSGSFWEAVNFFSVSAIDKETGTKKGQKKQMPDNKECKRLFQACERLKVLTGQYATANRLAFLRSAKEALATRKQQAKQQSYDDLITRLANALGGPSGEALAKAIRKRYRAALIDESQDTDPLQWQIFQTVFAKSEKHWLYLIGDPKQAIYGFRGADVNTYLQAAGTAKYDYSLGTNWRSESALVEGVNALFSAGGAGQVFVEEKIEFSAVQPGPRADNEPIVFPGNQRPPPFHVWCWEPDGGTVSVGKAERQLPASVAAEISRLLSSGVLVGKRPIQPRDIAVLVESHRQARCIQKALHSLGIPSVEQAMESVFESDEARELEWILSAVLSPGREAAVKSALTTDALGFNATGLQALLSDEAAWQARLQAFARYRDLWEADGFFTTFIQLLRQESVLEKLLRYADAERRITNLIHVAELLEAACKAEHLGPCQLVQWLQKRRSSDEAAPDEFQLRLESDEDAVQIVTIHRSKGLQYPVVFCPFVSKDAKLRQVKVDGKKVMELVLYHRQTDGKLTWDLSAEPDPDNTQLAAREQLAEKVRLLYVALTRACNRCYLVSARYAKNKSTALAWLLHRAPVAPADPVKALNETPPPSGGWKAVWQEIAEAAQKRNEDTPAISVADLPIEPGEAWHKDSASGAELRAKVCARAIGPSWSLSSFTTLAAQLEFHSANDDEAGLDHDERASTAGAGSNLPEAQQQATGIFALPASARTGDCLHKILERFDFTNPDQSATAALVREQLEAAGISSEAHGIAVSEMLERVRRVSLDPANPGSTLAEVPASQRLTEMEFHFPAAKLNPNRLMDVIRSSSASHATAKAVARDKIAAFLKGFIDLVFVFEGRYHIIDWKSNLLGCTPQDYTQAAVQAEIAENYYDLQYHIYTVALHKFLSCRLPGYDYETHFGAVHYIFLRGVDPERPELGVFNARPPQEMIQKLCNLLGEFEEALS